MRAQRSGRARCVALAAVVSTVLTLGVDVVAFADEGVDHGQPGLESLGFVHLQDLTVFDRINPTEQKHPSDLSSSMLIGSPAPGRMLLLAPYDHSLITLSTAQLPVEQVSLVRTPNTAGSVRSTTLAVGQQRLFLGTAIAKSTIGCSEPVLCTAGPLAVSPEVVTISLTSGTSQVYTLPSDFNGTDVVAMTSTKSAAGQSLVYALLYSDLAGYNGYQGAAGHILELVALDGDKLAAGDDSPLLWSYSIPSCTSLPYTSTNDHQDFLGIAPGGASAYFVCRGSTPKSTTGNVIPAGAVVVDFDGTLPTKPDAPDSFRTTYYPQGAGTAFVISGGDETRGLAFLTSVASINKQYVFDVAHRAWTGSVPFPTSGDGNLWGTAPDASTGRDYVVYPRDFVIAVQDDQLPVPQGARLALGDLVPSASTPIVDPYSHTLFIAGSFRHRDGTNYPVDDAIALFRDTRPVPEHVEDSHPDQLTHDDDITPETPVSYGAFASAYGARATFVGGLHSTVLGFGNLSSGVDPGYPLGQICSHSPDTRACFASPKLSDDSRSVGLGVVDGVEASNTATKASAAAMQLDAGSSADIDALGGFRATADLWDKFGSSDQPPPPTPGGDLVTQPTQEKLAPAECFDLEGKDKDPVSSNGALAVCHGDPASQQASAAAVGPGQVDGLPMQVAYAAAATTVGRVDNVPLTVAKAEARGVRIAVPGGPTVDIGRITAEATSAAAGRKGTAKSEFVRTVSNVTVTPPGGGEPYFSCGFAGATGEAGQECDPRALTDAVSEQSPSPVQFVMPTRDLSPGVAGSPGGAQAEVIKDRYAFWNDYFANGDAGYEIPALRVLLIGDQAQPSRVVLNLAAVHVESHQIIGVAPPPVPEDPLPSLVLTLVDAATPPVPLSGATFTLQGPDGDEPLTCLTAADGIGTCRFEDLAPGDYTIQETEAPPGFAPVDDFSVTLERGHDYTAPVVNLPAIGTVKISVVSAGDEKPLEGAEFAMFKGKDVLATPLAKCTTDAQGACGFDKVPLGEYTMLQTLAPEGFEVSDSVSFSLTKPLEVASLRFVDGIPPVPPVPPTVIHGTPPVPPTVIPGKPAVPPRFIPGKPPVPPRTMVLPALEDGTGVADGPALEPAAYETSAGPSPVIASQPSASGPLDLGTGGLGAVSARLARLVIHSPQQAVLLLFVWLVLGMPVYLWVRRRQFITATEGI